MDCTSTQLPYGETGFFSSIVSAYVNQDEELRPFYKFPVSEEGFSQAIAARDAYNNDRRLLVDGLKQQYTLVPLAEKVSENIDRLLQKNTYTITTAHQPAIFTGTLFFIYKIIHVIRIADHFNARYPDKHFVPVYYMGSEDADLDELGHIFMDGEKVAWRTDQKGAVGRMNTDGLNTIISRIEGEIAVLPHGKELVSLLRECYLDSADIQTATFRLVHNLFASYGLVVLIPDNALFKKVAIPVFEDELLRHRAVGVVEEAIEKLSANFKVQAHPRQLNLFYLNGDLRERIEQLAVDQWVVVGTGISFTRTALLKELNEHPERFSPNVILRGLFQCMLLPDVAFVGGGGEIAYWLELAGVFDMYEVPFPLLVVRNSFLLVEDKWKEKLDKLRIPVTGIFRPERELLNELVKSRSEKQLTLTGEISDVATYYDKLQTVASKVDDTLGMHVAALQTRAIRPLRELEKKLLRAEKRKFSTQERQLRAVRQVLFPNNSLQERVDNFIPFYAKWGKDMIRIIYEHSPTLEQQFTVLNCK